MKSAPPNPGDATAPRPGKPHVDIRELATYVYSSGWIYARGNVSRTTFRTGGSPTLVIMAVGAQSGGHDTTLSAVSADMPRSPVAVDTPNRSRSPEVHP